MSLGSTHSLTYSDQIMFLCLTYVFHSKATARVFWPRKSTSSFAYQAQCQNDAQKGKYLMLDLQNRKDEGCNKESRFVIQSNDPVLAVSACHLNCLIVTWLPPRAPMKVSSGPNSPDGILPASSDRASLFFLSWGSGGHSQRSYTDSGVCAHMYCMCIKTYVYCIYKGTYIFCV